MNGSLRDGSLQEKMDLVIMTNMDNTMKELKELKLGTLLTI